MPGPRIKEEQSPEPSLSSIPLKSSGILATLFARSSPRGDRGANAGPYLEKSSTEAKPSKDDLYPREQAPSVNIKTESDESNDAAAAIPAPATDRAITPQEYRLGGAGDPFGTRPPPLAAWLSSRPLSALETPQQTVALNKTRSQNGLLFRNNIARSTRLPPRFRPRTFPRTISRAGQMDPFKLDDENPLGASEQPDLNAFDAFSSMMAQMPQTVTVPLNDYQNQQNYVLQLQSTLGRQHKAITELIGFNHNMHSAMQSLNTRVTQLERAIEYPQAPAITSTSTGAHASYPSVGIAASCAPSPKSPPAQTETKGPRKGFGKRSFTNAVKDEGVTLPGRTKYRKKLQVKIPDHVPERAPAIGLPTPMLSAPQTAPTSALEEMFPATPRTPYTPGRIGPPDSYKKTTTSINKREIHNLNKFIPPANVQLPLVPLTDTEVIVYFFNSLSRPIVSLRLYARGWGPASIVQALNDHREVNPPYLRNTCSVKCTTAIKLGKNTYGEEWDAEHRAVLANASDAQATDLIRADENANTDYYIRALGVGMKEHPSGQDAGVFTACVKYCIENDAPYTVSNVYQLAVDLQNGKTPQHPASPDPANVASPPKLSPRVDAGEATEEEWSEDEGLATPSPLVERKSRINAFGVPIGFPAVNASRKCDGEADE